MADTPLEWSLPSEYVMTMGFALVREALTTAREQLADLLDLFPFRGAFDMAGTRGDDWVTIRIVDRIGSGVPTVSELQGEELEALTRMVAPFRPRDHAELAALLGSAWVAADRFTYVGPYRAPNASWQDAAEHLVTWLNASVLPDVLARNEARVLRAIPTTPQFDMARITSALWVLESDAACTQGTAFALAGVGLVTCQHVLADDTVAFRPADVTRRLPVRVRHASEVLDLAILDVDDVLEEALERGTADGLTQMAHLAIAGFPNYRLGDSGVFIPGLVAGFRPVSGVRRILTNAAIVAGNSGGPAIGADGRVVGVAVTGADRMENATGTENHGVVPIDALTFLTA